MPVSASRSVYLIDRYWLPRSPRWTGPISVRRLAHDAPSNSRVGASGKPGAVHSTTLTREIVEACFRGASMRSLSLKHDVCRARHGAQAVHALRFTPDHCVGPANCSRAFGTVISARFSGANDDTCLRLRRVQGRCPGPGSVRISYGNGPKCRRGRGDRLGRR
jgi:hypothetical protein